MLAQIGKPLDQPLVATAQVLSANGHLTDEIAAQAHAVLDHQLANVNEVGQRIRKGKVSLF